MKTTTTITVQRGEDGPPHNCRPIYRIMLTVTIEGTPPITRRIGEFDEGYDGIAKQFCEWFNSKLEPKS